MKQIILIRKDLKMRRGKEIAQGAHASNKVLIEVGFYGETPTNRLIEWLNTGTKKVCVQVNSEQELIDLWNKGQDAGIPSHIIQDSGLTEFDGVPTYTACAIGPAEDELVDSITGHLKLY